MYRKLFGPLAGLALCASATSALAKEEQLSGLALQQIQAKDFETTADVLFPAIVTVLQDSGYRVTEADRASGFISGVGSSEQKLTFNIWFGFGSKKLVPMVSAFIEQRGPGIARARLNFVMSKAKSSNVYTDEKPITDPAVYRDAFERIEREVFVRQAMNASPTGSTGPATVAAPAKPAMVQRVSDPVGVSPATSANGNSAVGEHVRCETCR